MDGRRDNVVKFRPRPKKPPPPPRPRRPSSGEPAINWSRAPKAAALIVLLLLAMFLIGRLGQWISGLGA